MCCSVLQCVAVRCSVLQCASVCFSVLQCVAMCCSVLQCVAVCCSAQSGLFRKSFHMYRPQHLHTASLVKKHDSAIVIPLKRGTCSVKRALRSLKEPYICASPIKTHGSATGIHIKRHIDSLKRALDSLKRALYFLKIALYSVKRAMYSAKRARDIKFVKLRSQSSCAAVRGNVWQCVAVCYSWEK